MRLQELPFVRRQDQQRERHNAVKLGLLLVVALTVAMLPMHGHALPHGCVSLSNSYNLSADLARRSVGLQVYRNLPCSFYFSPGDTYSGNGEYKVECETGGVATDSLEHIGPYVQVPIPQPCDPGALVTIHANQPFRGGAVVAGSPM